MHNRQLEITIRLYRRTKAHLICPRPTCTSRLAERISTHTLALTWWETKMKAQLRLVLGLNSFINGHPWNRQIDICTEIATVNRLTMSEINTKLGRISRCHQRNRISIIKANAPIIQTTQPKVGWSATRIEPQTTRLMFLSAKIRLDLSLVQNKHSKRTWTP